MLGPRHLVDYFIRVEVGNQACGKNLKEKKKKSEKIFSFLCFSVSWRKITPEPSLCNLINGKIQHGNSLNSLNQYSCKESKWVSLPYSVLGALTNIQTVLIKKKIKFFIAFFITLTFSSAVMTISERICNNAWLNA